MLLSIVIPAHNENRPDRLPRLVEQLAAEDLTYAEVVVVDDCSTDGTADYMAKTAIPRHGERDFRLVRRSHPGYCGGARNSGCDNARGRWVWMLDGDANITPGIVREICDVLQSRNPELVLMGINDWLPAGSPVSFSVTASSKVVRTDVLVRFREDWGFEDVDWWLRQLDTVDRDNVAYIEKVACWFTDENMSDSLNQWMREDPLLWKFIVGEVKFLRPVSPFTPGAFLKTAGALIDLKASGSIRHDDVRRMLDTYLEKHVRMVRRMFRKEAQA